MSHPVKLSIITVNKNNAAGLKKTMESVISQDFDDYEYIVIDGGSSDESTAVIREYEHKVAYWISEPDSGIFNAMNKGIGKASGEYCLFLNSGDWLVAPDVLRQVFNDPGGEDLLLAACRVSENGSMVHIARPPEMLTMASFYKRTIPHQSAFIKRSLFTSLGLYSEEYTLHGDYEFWIRAVISHSCTYRPVDVVITDYNLDGISGSEQYQTLSRKEVETILRNAIPRRVLEDYEQWMEEKTKMKPYFWASEKGPFRFGIGLAYKTAGVLSAYIKRVK